MMSSTRPFSMRTTKLKKKNMIELLVGQNNGLVSQAQQHHMKSKLYIHLYNCQTENGNNSIFLFLRLKLLDNRS